MVKILKLCNSIRENLGNSHILFTEGGCLHFHLILASIFPVEPYYIKGHVVSCYKGRYYDITGDVTEWVEENIDRNIEWYLLDIDDYLRRAPNKINLTGFCMIYRNKDFDQCTEFNSTKQEL